jgi:hypothetical protein
VELYTVGLLTLSAAQAKYGHRVGRFRNVELERKYKYSVIARFKLLRQYLSGWAEVVSLAEV